MGHQTIENGDGNQQVQVPGENHGPVAVAGKIAVVGSVSGGIVVNPEVNPEGGVHTFEATKKLRLPFFSTIIGVISGVITIIGFVTGASSLMSLCKMFASAVESSSANGFDMAGIVTSAAPFIVLIIISVFLVVLGVKGVRCYRFLKKNILWLPRHWRLWAWAGVKEEGGRTFPYMLRLSMKCPECGGGMRFMTLQDGKVPMAVCPRNADHSIRVDVAKNDFHKPLKR